MNAQTKAKLQSLLVQLQAPKAIGDTEIRLRALEQATVALLEALLAEPEDG